MKILGIEPELDELESIGQPLELKLCIPRKNVPSIWIVVHVRSELPLHLDPHRLNCEGPVVGGHGVTLIGNLSGSQVAPPEATSPLLIPLLAEPIFELVLIGPVVCWLWVLWTRWILAIPLILVLTAGLIWVLLMKDRGLTTGLSKVLEVKQS